MDLRKQAFTTDPARMGLTVQENEAYGGLMELGLPTSIVTLICFANGAAAKLYRDYQQRLKTLNTVDFGDLLLESLRLFRDNQMVAQWPEPVPGSIEKSGPIVSEHDLQLFTRRIKAFELTAGSTARHQERFATAIGLRG